LLYLWILCILISASELVIYNYGSRRKKREWILPPIKLMENVDYTKKQSIAKIRSDRDSESRSLEYFLTGHGADKEPYNLFVVNPKNGFVRITGLLDREEISHYNLTGRARYRDGSMAEADVELKIQVEDQNDNPPTFKLFTGAVSECSKIGTPVMQISAEDADEHGTINSKIAYSIVKQTPEGSGSMFSIDRGTGNLYVKRHTLDRETHDAYALVVQGVDMDGAANGNTGTGTVQIQILDINDNVPTLEKDEYTGSVDEGVSDVVVMRIKAQDKDMENTNNWLALFNIIKGNEDELFSIETDPKTNEGILKLVKVYIYAKFKIVLVFSTKPLAPGGKSYPIKIGVNNLPDGPGFSPAVKDLPVSENPEEVHVPVVIGSFLALDGDTGETAENVRYAKGHDPDNWLAIDEDTSEIKLLKIPDRESKLLVNGTYFAKILCMTKDVPPKTATGTIALKVEDTNDNCPKLTSTYENVCSDTKVVNISAFDEDVYPNGEPYTFVLIKEETRGEWEIAPINGTSVSLHSKDLLWPGFYELTMEISDMKGLACEDKQKLQVEVCTCQKGGTCGVRTGQQQSVLSQIGVPAIGPLITGLALLISELKLVPILLLSCQCGGGSKFVELPFDAKQHLILYHNEGKGEDKVLPLLSAPDVLKTTPGMAHGSTVELNGRFIHSTHTYQISTIKNYNVQHSLIPILNIFLTFVFQKVSSAAGNPQDSLLIYNYEGQGSPAGSVGCSSLLESDNDLEFLSDLGPKFMTLAEICSPPKPRSPPTKVEYIVKSADTSFKSETSVTTNTIQTPKSPTPPPQQNTAVSKTINNSIITETTNNSVITETTNKSIITKNNEKSVITETNNKSDALSIMNTSQTLLVQQQPLYYLVEHQVPHTVILAERPAQGMYLINGPTGVEGLILQNGNITQGTLEQQGMYMIDGASIMQGGIVLDGGPSPTSPGRQKLKGTGAQGIHPGRTGEGTGKK
uniref:Cadherin domain-containing protein n=1 Tax=Electrophorus electricus TaxID=8005 RepID=A0A4W4DNE3_ELEEL